jgi:hypothetical protein
VKEYQTWCVGAGHQELLLSVLLQRVDTRAETCPGIHVDGLQDGQSLRWLDSDTHSCAGCVTLLPLFCEFQVEFLKHRCNLSLLGLAGFGYLLATDACQALCTGCARLQGDRH